jgi:hypothetical protein
VADRQAIEYFHIELEVHEVLLAEGAAAESFVDDGSRMVFHNAADFFQLHPDAVARAAVFCAPRVGDGPQLEAIQHRLGARAGAGPGVGPLRGRLERVANGMAVGWALNFSDPSRPVALEVWADHRLVARPLANRHRRDLEGVGDGSGRHGWQAVLPARLDPDTLISVRRAGDGALLPNAPLRAAQA